MYIFLCLFFHYFFQASSSSAATSGLTASTTIIILFKNTAAAAVLLLLLNPLLAVNDNEVFADVAGVHPPSQPHETLLAPPLAKVVLEQPEVLTTLLVRAVAHDGNGTAAQQRLSVVIVTAAALVKNTALVVGMSKLNHSFFLFFSFIISICFLNHASLRSQSWCGPLS